VKTSCCDKMTGLSSSSSGGSFKVSAEGLNSSAKKGEL
jgi:hypothetical protein